MCRDARYPPQNRPANSIRIAAMIEAGPSRSTNQLWSDFTTNGVRVAYTSFSRFIGELGYSREPATNRLIRND